MAVDLITCPDASDCGRGSGMAEAEGGMTTRLRRRGLSAVRSMAIVMAILLVAGLVHGASTIFLRMQALPEAARIVSRVAIEARRINADGRASFTLDLQEVMSALRHEDLDMRDGRISLPLDGAIYWIARDPAPGSHDFSLLAGWEQGGANAGVLCTYLATAGTEDAQGWRSGPAGNGYRVARASCEGPGALHVELAYHPRG